MPEHSLKEKTAKGLLWGGINNGAMQVLNLIFGIITARILNDSDYGMVGMLSIFSLIAGSLQESGFTAALANKQEARHEDYNAVFWFCSGLSLCLYLILAGCAPLIADFYHNEALISLARYSFLGFFIASLGIPHSTYLFRNLMVKQKALSCIIALIVSGCVGVTMALLGYSYWGIATQSIVYVSVINLCYLHFSPWRPTLPRQLQAPPEHGGFQQQTASDQHFQPYQQQSVFHHPGTILFRTGSRTVQSSQQMESHGTLSHHGYGQQRSPARPA